MNETLIGNLKSKTSWVATIVTIFGLLYDNWNQVAQLIPPQYVGKSFTVLGLLMLILRNVSNQSISEKGSKEGGFARISLLAIMSGLILIGCATFQNNQSTFRLSIDVAVTKFIDNSSPDVRQSRIQHTIQIAEAVKSLAISDSTTIPGLEDAVTVQIRKLNLSPTDQILALDLVRILVEELKARVGQNLLSNDQKIQVSIVMDWVIQTANSLSNS